MANCQLVKDKFVVGSNVLSNGPCALAWSITPVGSRYIFSCNGNAILCTGDGGKIGSKDSCSSIGKLGCSAQTKDVTVNSAETRLYVACFAGVTTCEWDNVREQVSVCQPLVGAECNDTGDSETGVAMINDTTLAVNCQTGGTLAFDLDGTGTMVLGQRLLGAECTAVSGQHQGMMMPTPRRFLIACDAEKFLFCEYTYGQGLHGCQLNPGGPPPSGCGASSVVDLPSGSTALFCMNTGYHLCGGTADPTGSPTGPSSDPAPLPTPSPSPVTPAPSPFPTMTPSATPSRASAAPTAAPTESPSAAPGAPSGSPSGMPSAGPLQAPTTPPAPSRPSVAPTAAPSGSPTEGPSVTLSPSPQPTPAPSAAPSGVPTGLPSSSPTAPPSGHPTRLPSTAPSLMPSARPSGAPTNGPTAPPSAQPTRSPTTAPSPQPTRGPTSAPTVGPSAPPTAAPSGVPAPPSMSPSLPPSVASPSRGPSRPPGPAAPQRPARAPPSGAPSAQPSARPSPLPSGEPTEHPSKEPSGAPSHPRLPSAEPRQLLAAPPSASPSSPADSRRPFAHSVPPTTVPSVAPSAPPTAPPSRAPCAPPSTVTARVTGPPTSTPVAPTAAPQPAPWDHRTESPAEAAIIGSVSVANIMDAPSPGMTTVALTLGTLCPERERPAELSMALHPLGFAVGGDILLGALVGNAVLTVAFLAVAGIIVVVAQRAHGKCIKSPPLAVHAQFGIPGKLLLVPVLLFQGTSYALTRNAIEAPPSASMAAVVVASILGVCLLIITPAAADLLVAARADGRAVYIRDPAEMPFFAEFILGPGEWVSTGDDLWFTRCGKILKPYKPLTARSAVRAQFAEVLAVSILTALAVSVDGGCGPFNFGLAGAFLAHGVWCLRVRPYARPRDEVHEALLTSMQTAAMACKGVGYSAGHSHGGEFRVANVLLVATAVFTGGKLVLDIGTEAYIRCTQRRVRLQRGQLELSAAATGALIELDSVSETFKHSPAVPLQGRPPAERQSSIDSAPLLFTPRSGPGGAEATHNTSSDLAQSQSRSPLRSTRRRRTRRRSTVLIDSPCVSFAESSFDGELSRLSEVDQLVAAGVGPLQSFSSDRGSPPASTRARTRRRFQTQGPQESPPRARRRNPTMAGSQYSPIVRRASTRKGLNRIIDEV